MNRDNRRHRVALGAACALAFAAAVGAPGTRVAAQTATAPIAPPPQNGAAPPNAASTGAPQAIGVPLNGGPITTAPPSSGPDTSASPSIAASAAPNKGRRRANASTNPLGGRGPEPSATPTSPAFATLDGTWEVQLQYPSRTDYGYLAVKQGTSGTLSGTLRLQGATEPFDGTYDGRLIRLTVKDAVNDKVVSGYVEGASDMVGTIDFGTGKSDPIAFTAEHRAPSGGLLRHL